MKLPLLELLPVIASNQYIHRNKDHRGREGGAALILVLACLIIVSALTVGFLMSMRTKEVLSKSGADATNVKLLSETAVNIAISQVHDATKTSGLNGWAWASQPGMIRLYATDGSAASYYKLYSSDTMGANGTFTPASDAVPGTWAANPAVYVDLNAPLDGLFPIVDGNATLTSMASAGPVVAGDTIFALNSAPGATTAQPAPMPVKWLYVLKDGALAAADASSSGSVATVSSANATNPIVGRIAFWTDDETCKVNINTASVGSFWSTPRFSTGSTSVTQSTYGDRGYATSQPARGEFQRYPGHPATVSLDSVLSKLSNNPLTADQVFALTPRYFNGGSMGGTIPNQNITTQISTPVNRLYASVDELLFNIPTAGGNRSMNAGMADPSMVKSSKFFLTTCSRAPELNLFGLPRIATWPIHEVNDTNFRTVDDRVIAFCGTLGNSTLNYPFYFTRHENVLPTNDINLPRNVKLLDYLDRLTNMPIPGFGGSFQGKYQQVETRQILTEIFDYIRCTNLIDKTTPQSPAGFYPYTFGVSSYGQYSKGTQDQGRGRSLGTAAPAIHAGWGTKGFGGRFLQVSSVHLHFVGLGNSTTALDPLQLPSSNSAITLGTGIAANGTISGNATAVQAFVYLSTLNPSEGIEWWSPGHWIEIEGLEKFGIELDPSLRVFPAVPIYTNLGFPAKDPTDLRKTTMSIAGNMMGGGGVGGARVVGLAPYGFTYAQNELKRLTKLPPGDARWHFPFFSFILPVSSASPTMAFSGGTITIRIYAEPQYPTASPYTAVGALIQTLSVTFPPATFPTPLLATNRVVGSGVLNGPNERWRQYDPSNNGSKIYFEATTDVLRSIPLADGDIRQLIGPTPSASAPFFQAQADYYNSATRMVPGANNNGLDYTTNGKLIAGAGHWQNYPWVPNHINGVTTSSGAPGDWDNAIAFVGDGPFINAADSGSVAPAAGSGNLAYFDNSNSIASSQMQFASPNRQMPGPGMFGSLPTGVQRRLPWQTLLFRPGPTNHPGLGTPVAGPVGGPFYTKPPDHLFLDLFWMPVVKPYAISEPFSTAGKINLNQQLVPFTYIDRMAGLRAALAAERVAMIDKSKANAYKVVNGGYTAGLDTSRLALNLSELDGTLRQVVAKFASGDIFRSASEICDIYLVPLGLSWNSDAAAQTAWYGNSFALVGDNTRERPYADLYNKLTTKSNTFTVHYYVQGLMQSKDRKAADPTHFDPSRGDRVGACLRGSTTFERYLDPADPRVISTDPAAATAATINAGTASLEQYYRTRIINTSIFNP